MAKFFAFLLALALLPAAHAQSTYTGLDHINRMLGGAGSAASMPGGGASLTLPGSATARNPNGLRIPIPYTAKATLTPAALGRAGARMLGGPLGAAAAVGSLLYPLFPEYEICSNPLDGILCRPAIPQTGFVPSSVRFYVGNYAGDFFTTQAAACSAEVGKTYQQKKVVSVVLQGNNCRYHDSSNSHFSTGLVFTRFMCLPDTASVPAGSQCNAQPIPEHNMKEAELATKLEQKFQVENGLSKQFVEMSQSQIDERWAGWPAPHPYLEPSTPLEVQADPVTTPERTIKTRVIDNPDGTSYTEQTKQSTTVTPETTGTTLSDSKTQLTTKTVTTITTINNITNETRTETSTEEEPVPAEKAEPEKTDLCKDHPDIVACQKLGAPLQPAEIPNQNISVSSIAPDTGWGASNGVCPAPRVLNLSIGTIYLPYDLICSFASMIRPLIIGFAWLAAAMTFFGFARKD